MRDIVDGVAEIPEECNKEDGGIEGNLEGGDIKASRGVVGEEKQGTSSWKVHETKSYGR